MGHNAMVVLSRRTAAQQAGASESTILRVIAAGRPPTTRTSAGGHEIGPSELARVYPPKPSSVASDHAAQRSVGQDAPGDETVGVAPGVATRLAVMEVELKGLQTMVAELKQDQWRAREAERATLGPTRPWWKRLAG
ncbi:MAG: hypothetical protein GY798_14025 [Hyphomicrobiales bacterium]|nr:hypothetical protein [Hyphomicrobiales bacterium]